MESALREGGRGEGLKLIETLGWDGARLVRGERHLARLARSAALLGWACDTEAARAALRAGRDGPVRLRLTLDRMARIEVAAAPMAPAAKSWRVALAGTALDAADPWLSIKSTRRAVYDEARLSLPEGIDELLFLNESGDVCEGTITNVFFDPGDGMRTPPLACGLLPGVLRQEMLETGLVREAILRREDLGKVRLFVGNSLRGLIPAVWSC